jgi:zinc protease
MARVGVWGVAVAAAIGAALPGARGAHAAEAPVERVVLRNGLTVLLAVDHKAPVIAMSLTYRVGTHDDPEGRPGMSALAPRLMVRATAHVAEGEYDRRLEAAGGYDSAWNAAYDTTTLRVTLPSDQIALPLWLWSDQMGFAAPRIDDRLIAQQLAVVQNERTEKVDNVPGGRVPLMVMEALYPPDHPYHAGVVRSPDGLRGVTVQEVRAFLASRYTPDRAILVLAGDFDPWRAMGLVERYFGSLPAGRAVPRPAVPRPALAGEIRLQVAARVEVPAVTMAWPTAPLHQPGDAELDLVAELLTGSRAGWLRWTLINQLKIASFVNAHQMSHRLGSEFVITAKATPGHTAHELTEAIDEVLSHLQIAPPDAFSMRGAVAGFVLNWVFGLDQSGTRAGRYAECELYAVIDGCIETSISRYTSIAGRQLSEVAATALPLKRRVVIETTPSASAPPAGELRDRVVGVE